MRDRRDLEIQEYVKINLKELVEVRVDVSIPWNKDVLSYLIRKDPQLMRLRPLKRPLNDNNPFVIHDYMEQMRKRDELIECMAKEIAHAIYASFDAGDEK